MAGKMALSERLPGGKIQPMFFDLKKACAKFLDTKITS